MVRIHNVINPDSPDLAPYRSRRKMVDEQHQGLFIAEGEKVVTRLLATDFKIHSLLLTQDWLVRLRPLLDMRSGIMDVFITDKEGIEALTGYGCYQAIKALVSVPAQTELATIFGRFNRPAFLVAVDGLSSSENVGALVRNAVAFGAQAMIVGPTSCSPYIRRAVHSSMGTVFNLPMHYSKDLAATLRFLRTSGIRIVAAHPQMDERPLHRANFQQDLCLVLGSEGDGLSKSVLAECDDHLLIPMAHGTDSLNVASAAAVFFYEVFRQRACQD
ncbi:RNA methyltransferase [Verrucomicrobia bacterium]|nr:RNA methyltransferase [Verrucomicrobiota bacterium]MDB4664907.1 RNA methyltransferase [Verrucomicrobiota bacterium]MDG1890604.1 RNA methyltransferase [Verrucomicrobiota bacterium]